MQKFNKKKRRRRRKQWKEEKEKACPSTGKIKKSHVSFSENKTQTNFQIYSTTALNLQDFFFSSGCDRSI